MPIARLDNVSGFVASTLVHELLSSEIAGVVSKRVIKLITLFNPGTVVVFKLQIMWKDANGEDQTVRRFRDTMPANDGWVFGTLGAVWVLDSGFDGQPTILQIVLESEPSVPIEYSIDYVDTT